MDTGGLSFKVRQRTAPSSLAELSSAHPEKNSLYYRLQLVGFLPVHTLTTMPMLPWIVAEIRRHSSQEVRSALIPRWVKLYISQAAVCCEMDAGHSQQWDPLHYNIIFEHQPQRVYKLIHNSNDPSYFACLIREPGPGLPGNKSTCYVFRSADQAKSFFSLARRGRCVTVVCLPAMAKQNHGEYQRYGDTLHTVALAGASNNNENRRRKKKRK
ncbi:UNVERIFIED_CONTAM: hypothetical protein FKN15_052340 [Acipenser sinensis]